MRQAIPRFFTGSRHVFVLFSEFRQSFETLESPPSHRMAGKYTAEVPGPWWYRWTFKPAMALTALRGWTGKEIFDNRTGINLVKRRGGIIKVLPMAIKKQAARIDGQPARVIVYGEDAPFPWCRATDELRELEEGRLLGMTIFDLPLVRHIAFPFILNRK
ncbi:MAG: hypothetical protein MI863_06740 [Desulfobacterales bacterium]|nr:hypothetical protein [Desulfobacterales bacterium]